MSYFLSDRYETIRVLYESTYTRVVLVKTIDTGDLYVIKGIRKDPATPEHFFLEASLLQDLNHPGIPILHETQEDASFFYIVEEYIYGDSLDQYLLYHQHISQDTFLQFAMQLCNIMEYLHTRNPNPILYLDLKPEHIIVCGNQLKLINFGIAKILTSSGNDFQNFGTKKYAAPEQRHGGAVDERTDIYAVGKILSYMLLFLPIKSRIVCFPLIARTLCYDKKRRITSISRLQNRLQRIQQKNKKEKKNKKHLLKRIAIVGSEEGVGCTHVAVALVCYLNQAGFYAYYKNESEQPTLERMLQQDMACIRQDGFIYHEFFRGCLTYGPAVAKSELLEGIQVVDRGCKEDATAGATIYVCSGRIWQKRPSDAVWATRKNAIIVGNHFSRYDAKTCARAWKRRVYLFPYQSDPFHATWAVRRLFSNMLKKELLCEKEKQMDT